MVKTDSTRCAYSWRAKGSVAVLLLMATLAVGTLIGYRSVVRSAGRDEITLEEQRFDGVRKSLPRRGIVGYLSDKGDGLDGGRAYYRTQYFMAPVIVAPDVNREFVVANVSSPSSLPALAAAHGLTVAQDYGNGVALLRSSRR